MTKNNIILFTSAMDEKSFSSYSQEAKIKPNPSNQNFYHRLIIALNNENNVYCVSHRPFVKGMFKENIIHYDFKEDEFAKYYYTTNKTGFIFKLFKEVPLIVSRAEELIKDNNLDDFIIISDVLRIPLIIAAIYIRNKYRKRIVGMITDNPANLSNVKTSYVDKVLQYGSQLDGYLTLTDGLNSIFNKNNAPHYTFEGLVEKRKKTLKPAVGNYFYFSGSLYERYGVKKLIDAFNKSTIKEKILIAGDGPLKEEIMQMPKKDKRFLYLSTLNREKNLLYQAHSIANINPRPLNAKIDDESIPSKLLEYLSSNVITISTKHPKLYHEFKEEVIWIDNNSEQSIIEALNTVLKTPKSELAAKARKAYKKVNKLYGVSEQGNKISSFLNKIINL